MQRNLAADEEVSPSVGGAAGNRAQAAPAWTLQAPNSRATGIPPSYWHRLDSWNGPQLCDRNGGRVDG